MQYNNYKVGTPLVKVGVRMLYGNTIKYLEVLRYSKHII